MPSTIRPPGASRARISDHASAHRVDRVLAQHVERAHQNRSAPGQFEAAETELDAVARRAADPLGVDLQADHPDVGAHDPQPARQLEGRHRQRAVAEVDDQWVGGRLQRGAHPRRVHQPAVAAAQPVVPGGAPRDARRPGLVVLGDPVSGERLLGVEELLDVVKDQILERPADERDVHLADADEPQLAAGVGFGEEVPAAEIARAVRDAAR